MNDIPNPLRPSNYPTLPGLGALATKMGIELTAISPDYAEGTMPVEGNTQPYGLLHGGASAVLGETLGSFAAGVHAGATGRQAVGIEVSMTHHRSATAGMVVGRAKARFRGTTIATYELTVHDETERLVASGHLTCMLISPRPESDAPAPG